MDMNESPNCAEYGAEKKSEGKVRLQRTLMLLLYVAFAGGYIFVTCGLTKMLPLIAGLPLFLYVLWLCTWRFVSYDVEYTFRSGTMTFYRVNGARGRRTRREQLRLHVRDAETVVLLSSEAAASAEAGVQKKYDFTSSLSAPNAVLLVGRDSEGRRVSVRFDCIRRVAALMKIFCPSSQLEPNSFSV